MLIYNLDAIFSSPFQYAIINDKSSIFLLMNW